MCAWFLFFFFPGKTRKRTRQTNPLLTTKPEWRFPRGGNAIANPFGFPRGQLFNEKQGASALVHRYRECKYRARYDLWPVCLTTARESGCISCKCLRVHWKPPLTRKGSSFNVGKSHGPAWFVGRYRSAIPTFVISTKLFPTIRRNLFFPFIERGTHHFKSFSSKFLSFPSRVAIQFPLRFEINDRWLLEQRWRFTIVRHGKLEWLESCNCFRSSQLLTRARSRRGATWTNSRGTAL